MSYSSEAKLTSDFFSDFCETGRITIVLILRPDFKLGRKVVEGKKESRGLIFDGCEKTKGKEGILRKFCPTAVISHLIKPGKKIKLLLKYLGIKCIIKNFLRGCISRERFWTSEYLIKSHLLF